MPAASTDPGTTTTLVGVIGYTPVVEAYPLGPALMRGLERRLAPLPGVRVQNMTWGPIHIVQQFQDAAAPAAGRVVLIGAAAVSRAPGAVAAWRWKGGAMPDLAVHERVYEAVTGVVDLENTLMIGERFGIWPGECYTVEADIPAETFGRMAIAESAGQDIDIGFAPERMIVRLIAHVADLAANGPAARGLTGSKSAEDLVPAGGFLRNRPVATTKGRQG